MSIRRFFMDWSQPALPSAVEYLSRHYYDKSTNRLDMDKVLVVVPGSRAGRRLSQLLANRAQEMNAVLFPPAIQTVGALPENLYEPKQPFADELTQHLAWVESIKSQKARARKFFPNLPRNQDTMEWLDMASMLARIHRELAADGLDFADVVEKGRSLKGFSEGRRWRFLRSLQEGYLDILDGLKLWDMQTARLYAIKQKECATELDLFMLATVDLNQATRQMLQQVSSRVVALIHAPESEALGFDDYGCLEPFYWKDKKIPIRDEQVVITDQPADQANAVCHWMGELDGVLESDNTVVGVPANEVALYITRKLEDYSVSAHWSVGRSLKDTSPASLLESISAVLEMDRYPEYAALIRHPDIENWLEAVESGNDSVSASHIIGESDAYFAKHLVPSFGTWLGDRKHQISLRWAIENIRSLLKPFEKKSLPLSSWATPLLEMLSDVYQHVELDLDDAEDSPKVGCLSQIRAIMEGFLDIPDSLDVKTDAVNVIRIVLQKLGQLSVTDSPEPDAIELLGWLELPLDTAKHVIVTGFNEGVIPESLNADMFLPNSMRSVLSVTDNQRRYARDAYAVSSMVHSKQELLFVVGKRNLAGDPLMPSRLFFATDREAIARRVIQFSKPVDYHDSLPAIESLKESEFAVPYPELEDVKIESISVTSFRTYLQCPYRFYLQHVLRLRQVHDADRELNALTFGNMMHELFRRFGESRLRFSENEIEIQEFLDHELDDLIRNDLGLRHLPAVEIQLQQIRHRLKGFSQWQSKRTSQGWEIKFVEKRPLDPAGADFEIDDERTVKLKGTIDRIDYHKDWDTWQILDYKTGDKGEKPNQTHMESGQWVDLQLPLYRHIAKSFDVDGKVQLGYILVPKAAKEIKESLAYWSDQQIDEALQVAKDCARRIVDLDFWEPTHPAPLFTGREFAAICQDHVFEPRLGLPPDGEYAMAGGEQ